MQCRATQGDGSRWRVLTKRGPLENGMADHLTILALRTPWTIWKGKDMILKDEPPRLVSNILLGRAEKYLQKEWRGWAKAETALSCRCLVVKVWRCKEHYCIGSWKVRSMDQGKLDVVQQEMARVNTDILGISELKWMWNGEFNSEGRYIYSCGQEFP